jgi:alkylhydroperoxidase family enzyme
MADGVRRARIPMLSLDESLAAAERSGVPSELADRNLFRALLHCPNLAKGVNDLLYSLLFDATLSDRHREFVIMRIGWVTRSDYEWTQHWAVAQSAFGCDPEDLLAVRDWRRSSRLDASDRAVLAATDETLDTGSIGAETWAECERQLENPKACIELAAAIAAWRLISEITLSLEIPLESDTSSWPPDGTSPERGL